MRLLKIDRHIITEGFDKPEENEAYINTSIINIMCVVNKNFNNEKQYGLLLMLNNGKVLITTETSEEAYKILDNIIHSAADSFGFIEII